MSTFCPQGTPAGPGVVDLTYTITEGSRSFVERINITGNTRTKDKVLRREISVLPGDIFNTVRVEISEAAPRESWLFRESRHLSGRHRHSRPQRPPRAGAGETTGALNFGAGFSTIESLIGFVELTQGNFDFLNYPTFTGAGQKFRLAHPVRHAVTKLSSSP